MKINDEVPFLSLSEVGRFLHKNEKTHFVETAIELDLESSPCCLAFNSVYLYWKFSDNLVDRLDIMKRTWNPCFIKSQVSFLSIY